MWRPRRAGGRPVAAHRTAAASVAVAVAVAVIAVAVAAVAVVALSAVSSAVPADAAMRATTASPGSSPAPQPTPADAEAVLLDDPGSGWEPLPAQPPPADALGEWRNETLTLRIDVAVRPPCTSDAADPRMVFATLLLSTGLAPVGQAGDAGAGAVQRFRGELAGVVGEAVVFATARFAYAVTILGDPAHGAGIASEVQRIAGAQAARDGGAPPALGPPAGGTAPIDGVLLDRSPVAGLAGPLRFTGAAVGCSEPATTGVQAFLAAHASQRTATFTSVTTATQALAVIDLVEYPFELFAAAASGTRFTALAPTDARGLPLPPGARSFVAANDPTQAFVVFRRGRFGVMVTAASPDGHSLELAAAFASAQAARLPDGATSSYRFPSPLRSVATSAGLVVLLGSALLLGRRLASGSVPRHPVAPAVPGPGPLVVDVGAPAAAIRRRGALVATVQIAALAVVFVGLSADVGNARYAVAAVGLAAVAVATAWVRRRDEGHVDPHLRRSRPRPSPVAVLLGAVAVAVLVGGAVLVVRGLQEVAFKPSLSHLRLADRFGIEPRRLAWALAGCGVVVLGAGVAVSRAAREVARIGWRALGIEAAPMVYLRSFHDDDRSLPYLASARRPWIEVLGLRAREPFEESIAWELASYGPVIAIGRPGRSRASLGAAREHLSGDAWQRVIADRLAAARAVVVTIGATDGLAWELGHLAAAGLLSKTTFLVPPVAAQDAASRWSFTVEALRRAGAPVHAAILAAVPAASAVTIQLESSGGCTVHAADRRDEATYRAAIDAAVARQQSVVDRARIGPSASGTTLARPDDEGGRHGRS